MNALNRLSKEEMLKAIRQGVHDAMWQLFTNATDMPCHDFYEHIQAGVKEAMMEIKDRK